jgi:hypothetical protein
VVRQLVATEAPPALRGLPATLDDAWAELGLTPPAAPRSAR